MQLIKDSQVLTGLKRKRNGHHIVVYKKKYIHVPPQSQHHNVNLHWMLKARGEKTYLLVEDNQCAPTIRY